MSDPPPRLRRLDLRALDLPPGGATVVRGRVPVEPIRLGGQEYRTRPAAPEVRINVSRSASGRLFRLRGRLDVVGPCWRCLDDAAVPLDLDVREFAATGRPADAPPDEDLESAYIEDEHLDVAAWTRDAIAEVLPPTILCREDCAGLCPTCGSDLNAGPCDCPPPPPDDRWAALAALAERIRAGGEDGPSSGDPPSHPLP